jgi:hypothetical protein
VAFEENEMNLTKISSVRGVALVLVGLLSVGLITLSACCSTGSDCCGSCSGSKSCPVTGKTGECPADQETTCAGCAAAKTAAAGGWCDGCGVGYAKGQKTACKGCFTALQTDGRCEVCGVAFQNGRKL